MAKILISFEIFELKASCLVPNTLFKERHFLSLSCCPDGQRHIVGRSVSLLFLNGNLENLVISQNFTS